MVRISACHAEDPGSIPGGGVFPVHIPIFSIPACPFCLSCAVDRQDHFPAAGWSVGGFGCGLLLVSHLGYELAGRHSRALPCRTSPPTPTILHDHVPHGHPPPLCGHDQDAVGHLPNARSGASCAHLPISKTVWPSGLRRWLQAPVRKGVGLNPTAVTFSCTCDPRQTRNVPTEP